MQQFVRGTNAIFYHTFTNVGGVPVDPDATPTIGIMYGATVTLTDTIMTKISTGFYSYTWSVPVAQTLGFYTAIYKGTIATIPTQAQENFEVTIQPVAPTIPSFYCTWDDVKAQLLGLDVADIPTTLQDRIENIHIPTIKNEIDCYCRQNFNLTTITQFFDGTGTEKVVLPRRPVNNLLYCVLRVIPSISWYTFARWRHINVVDSEGYTIATQGGPEPHTGKTPPYSPGDYDWETTIEKADLFVDCANGMLVIPPRILYLEMQAIPFWNYTWLKGNANIEVQYIYGYEDTNFPLDLRYAAAKLVACKVLQIKGIGQSAGGANSVTIDGVSRNFGGLPYGGLIQELKTEAYSTLDKFRRMEIG